MNAAAVARNPVPRSTSTNLRRGTGANCWSPGLITPLSLVAITLHHAMTSRQLRGCGQPIDLSHPRLGPFKKQAFPLCPAQQHGASQNPTVSKPPKNANLEGLTSGRWESCLSDLAHAKSRTSSCRVRLHRRLHLGLALKQTRA